MQIIYDQCYRAKAIIQRLLTFSKPSASDMQDYDISEVIDEVVDLVEHQYGLDNIKIINEKYTKRNKIFYTKLHNEFGIVSVSNLIRSKPQQLAPAKKRQRLSNGLPAPSRPPD